MHAQVESKLLQLGSLTTIEDEVKLEEVTEPVTLEPEPEPDPPAAAVILVTLKQTPVPTMSTYPISHSVHLP